METTFRPTDEFSTEWALNWAKNYTEFSETSEQLVYTNVRSVILEAQREFEKHLSNLMNHQAHQSEY
jgi:hypothetical protein